MIGDYSVTIHTKKVSYAEFKKKYSDFKHYDYNAEKKTITVEVPDVEEIRNHYLDELIWLKNDYCERWSDKPTRLERYLSKIAKTSDKVYNMSEEELLNIYFNRKLFEIISLFE